MTKPVFRFAPSPNGYLHLGHAYSALFTWAQAQKAGGTVLLRIEDIDASRCRPEFTTQIFDDLAWLGLSWPQPVRIQSEHFADYQAAAQKLQEMGLLYPCFCSRKQIAATAGSKKDPDGAPRYPQCCKALSEAEIEKLTASGKPFALRLDMAKAKTLTGFAGDEFADLRDWGDVVLVRKDTPTSYHLSVVVDDALQGVTHVTRGMDMYSATAIHILLQKLLDLPTPHYAHHQLICDAGGRKLSKRFADRALKTLRQEGMTAKAVKALLTAKLNSKTEPPQ